MLCRSTFALTMLLAAGTASAETRLGSHEHGLGTLNIAVEGKLIYMELEAPGADIVGFEHPAKSAEDKAAIAKAKATLSKAAKVMVLPKAAGCDLERVSVELVTGDDHDGHDHGHDHGKEKKKGADGESHTEFFAKYRFGCADPDAVTGIQFPYFKTFGKAAKLRIQMISRRGTAGYTVVRKSPSVSFGGS